MYNFLLKRGQLMALLLGVGVVAIYFITVISGLGSAGYSTSDDLNNILKNNPDADFSFFDAGMYLTGGLIVLAAAAAVLFGLIQVLSSPKGALKGIIGVAVIAVLFFVLSGSSDAESAGKIGELVQRFNVSDSVSKYISGGLKTTMILAAASALFMVIGEVINLFK